MSHMNKGMIKVCVHILGLESLVCHKRYACLCYGLN